MEQLKTRCDRCNIKFLHGTFSDNLRGKMTRKFCDGCKLFKKREEARLYQRKKQKDYKHVLKHRIYSNLYYRNKRPEKGFFSK